MTSRFKTRKRNILVQLATPDSDYHDLSPKGSVDEPIRELIDEINRLDGIVTTSSCSGRISVFLEGRKADLDSSGDAAEREEAPAGPGGKGGGGAWLYISHTPVDMTRPDIKLMDMFDMTGAPQPAEETPDISARYIHLKFEPMILHILTASLDHAQSILNAALSAGFRESGAVSLGSSKTGVSNPMVAVRSTGYSFDSIIGYRNPSGATTNLVDEQCLRTLVGIANDRFKINSERIARFRDALNPSNKPEPSRPDWEDSEARKRRKREEGLARQRALQTQNTLEASSLAQETADRTVADMFAQ